MKKLFALFLVIGLFTLVSCGGAKKEEGGEATGTEQNMEQTPPAEAPPAEAAPVDTAAKPAEGGAHGGGH